MNEHRTLGKLPPDRIRMSSLPSVAPSTIERFHKLTDLTGTISDVCDILGINCVIPAAVLRPVAASQRIVGPALTMRNIERPLHVFKAVTDRSNGMGETEAHNLARPGDVLVIEGLTGFSNMGGQSASIGKREGEIGAVIDGSIRDPDQYEKIGWPVWCRGFTPITGKWRLETVEINGPVRIAGIQCKPGDLVCADSAGICFVPHSAIEEVLAMCEKFDKADSVKQADINAGMPLRELVSKVYK
ncbi:RraA family protein [soil metagenome]